MEGGQGKQARYVYNTPWKGNNMLYLKFGHCKLLDEIAAWQNERGYSQFPSHVTLTAVDPERFPPDDKETPGKVAVAIEEALEEFKTRDLTLHVDGLVKFGDYEPYKMRMLQIEAIGNFEGQNLKDNMVVREGGHRTLHPPVANDDIEDCIATSYEQAILDYKKIQLFREALCRKLGPQTVQDNCSDHTNYKPHLSAAYVNMGCEEGMSEEVALAWQQKMIDKNIFPTRLQATSISYMEMRDRIASDWEEVCKVPFADEKVPKDGTAKYLMAHL